ncbi:MAG: pyridoxal phosphate-dependent aminotransferase [Myxococcales bacterium]|nr:pyridoxal phosphate-dependent aminotransferase [Myxococcales bacterium]MCB9643095.1 pyridoxal phosphate-dependent aminotransferase [Myxococcales bacterium]
MTLSLSARAGVMPASPIRKLVPYADQAKARGVHVYHLNIGQPDIETPDVAIKALREFSDKIVSYTHSQGSPLYLEALREFYGREGIALEPWQINVTKGGSEAILFAMIAVLNEGDEILIPEPFYTNYSGFACMAGVKVRPLTTRVEDGFHLPDRETIEACLTPRTRAIMLCNPGNPTGVVYTREEIEMIASIVKKHDLWWIADEVYREFVFEPEPEAYPSVLNIQGLESHVIVVDSVSKRFSMCGARVGCLMSRNKQVMDAVLKMSQARLSAPQIEQYIATFAHRLPPEYMKEMIETYRGRRDVVFQALQQMPGVLAGRPEGAFYTIPRLPVEDTEDFARWLLTDFSRDGETVMVAPAAGFYATPGLGRNEIRIAYVLKEEALSRAMSLLGEAIQTYQSLR